jgi:carbohydrate-binding DOMON domain-containing protein
LAGYQPNNIPIPLETTRANTIDTTETTNKEPVNLAIIKEAITPPAIPNIPRLIKMVL